MVRNCFGIRMCCHTGTFPVFLQKNAVQKSEVLSLGKSRSRLLGHPVMDMIEKLAKTERKNGEYLATDCDVILGREPCAMCAMVGGFWTQRSVTL